MNRWWLRNNIIEMQECRHTESTNILNIFQALYADGKKSIAFFQLTFDGFGETFLFNCANERLNRTFHSNLMMRMQLSQIACLLTFTL